jgi:DNA topoisomerase-1
LERRVEELERELARARSTPSPAKKTTRKTAAKKTAAKKTAAKKTAAKKTAS